MAKTRLMATRYKPLPCDRDKIFELWEILSGKGLYSKRSGLGGDPESRNPSGSGPNSQPLPKFKAGPKKTTSTWV
jgi:hypothetical protein